MNRLVILPVNGNILIDAFSCLKNVSHHHLVQNDRSEKGNVNINSLSLVFLFRSFLLLLLRIAEV